MRTTIDIPADLLRQVKAQAALRGVRLKDYVADALRAAVHRTPPAAPRDRDSIEAQLSRFPLIRGEAGPGLRDLTPEKLHLLLEEEDVDAALHPRRR
jgi:hypothetical protein